MGFDSEQNQIVADQVVSVISAAVCTTDQQSIEQAPTGSTFATSLATVRDKHSSAESKPILTASRNFKPEQRSIIGDTVLTNKTCIQQWCDNYPHILGLEKLLQYANGEIAGTIARANIFQAFQEARQSMFWTGLCYLHGFGCAQRRTNGISIIYAAAVAGCSESMNYLGLCCFLSGDLPSSLVWFHQAAKQNYPLDNFATLCQLSGISSAATQKLKLLCVV